MIRYIKIVVLGLVACGWLLNVQATMPTNAPACIELLDQFEQPQKLSFPNTNITVLTIADRKGSEQVASWVGPVAQRFGKHVDVRGLADVSSVPRLLRGTVRASFQKNQPYPLMLDWTGSEAQKFAPKADVVTVLLIDGSGKIIRRYEGEAKQAQVQELCKLIESLLPKQETKPAGMP